MTGCIKHWLPVAALILVPGSVLAQDAALPAFDLANFAQSLPNPYFPMEPGQSRTLTGTVTDPDGTSHAMAIRTVLGTGPVVMGVQTTGVLVEEFEAGRVAERTTDYYATDSSGTVWYFGEDVTEYAFDDATGSLTSKPGSSWRAGVAGAAPGILMQAEPATGQPTFIGHAPDAGEMDIGEIVAAHVAADGPGGPYDDVIQIYTTSATDPDLRDYSWWARDVGLIRVQEDLSPALDHPKVELALQP